MSSYTHISVREKGTYDLVSSLVAIPVEISLDPVFLLTREDWRGKFNKQRLLEDEYILVYSPGYKPEVYEIAEKVSKEINVKIVTTLYTPQMAQYRNLKKVLAVGPWEFLNLLDHAKFIVSGSFHATAFSVLFNKPFYAVRGSQDNRMKTFLENANLLDRSICDSDFNSKINRILDLSFEDANAFFAKERSKSIAYLKESINNSNQQLNCCDL